MTSYMAVAMGITPKLDKLLEYLSKGEFFDIVKQTQQSTSSPPQPPPGHPPTPDFQGNFPTCTSHAIGKVIVEILDRFGFNCVQQKVVDALIAQVQPFKQAVHLFYFNNEKIAITFWDKEDTIEKKILFKMDIGLIVQRGNFGKGVEMTPDQLKLYHTRMVLT